MRTAKSRGRREALIPLYGELAAFVATIPRLGPKVLTNGDGLPWKTGFSSSWNKTMKRAGVGKHFHDLRGNAATTSISRCAKATKATAKRCARSPRP